MAASGCDVAILGEWWPQAPARDNVPVEALLAEAGWLVHHVDGAREADPGVLLASRHHLRTLPVSAGQGIAHRAAAVLLEAGDQQFGVIGVYVPTASRGDGRKQQMLEWLATLPDELSDLDGLILAGDFNCDHVDDTGARNRAVGEPAFAELFDHGWTDGYRALHGPGQAASWWWRRRKRAGGFRLDHVLLRGSVRPLAVRYLTRIGSQRLVRLPAEHEPALSDHAMLVADVECGFELELAPDGEPFEVGPRSNEG